MDELQVGIIVGTTREGRFSHKPASWLASRATSRGDANYELIDLRDYPLPFFNEPASPAWAPPADEVAQAWGRKMASLDGLIVVTAEYNHGPSAVLKNAFDYAYKEYARKPIAFVGYGGVGAARSIEQLRLVTIELQMAPIRHAIHIGLMEYMGLVKDGKTFDDFPHLGGAADVMLDDFAWWLKCLKKARAAA